MLLQACQRAYASSRVAKRANDLAEVMGSGAAAQEPLFL